MCFSSEHGFDKSRPTLFISEAVLFYVEPAAIAKLFSELFAHGKRAEAQYCFTDSMRPFVQGPFVDEIKPFLESQGAELLAHTSGAAVTLGVGCSASMGAQRAPSAAKAARGFGRCADWPSVDRPSVDQPS